MNSWSAVRCVLPALCTMLVLSCGAPPPAEPQGSPPGDEAAETVGRYTVRGELVELPDPEDPARSLRIRHEAIPDFRDYDGKLRGMDAMTMPFGFAQELSFDGLNPGDKVEFVLVVNWDAAQPMQVQELRKLPAETRLDLD